MLTLRRRPSILGSRTKCFKLHRIHWTLYPPLKADGQTSMGGRRRGPGIRQGLSCDDRFRITFSLADRGFTTAHTDSCNVQLSQNIITNVAVCLLIGEASTHRQTFSLDILTSWDKCKITFEPITMPTLEYSRNVNYYERTRAVETVISIPKQDQHEPSTALPGLKRC